MTLKTWLANGWLTVHQSSLSEVADLVSAVRRDLADCQTPQLSSDWRFNIAYNAALQSATVALAASGYRATREQHHFRVIHSLKWTIGADDSITNLFELFRRKRNIGTYERAGIITDQEAEEMYELAMKIYESVTRWLYTNHPEYLAE